MSNLKKHSELNVWPLPVRLFHWINLLLVLTLSFLGLVMMFKAELGISGTEAKVGLKTAHVVVGYLFITNIVLRLVYGMFAKNHGSLKSMLPGPSTLAAIKDYNQRITNGETPQYIGHTPKGKLAIGVMLTLMLVIAGTGLFRAGTDIYFPPFGSSIQAAIVIDGAEPAAIKPYDETYVDSTKLESIKPVKSLAGKIHLYGVYLLWLFATLHIAAVIYTENRHHPGLISAMFSGKKWFNSTPVDHDK